MLIIIPLKMYELETEGIKKTGDAIMIKTILKAIAEITNAIDPTTIFMN